MTDEYYASLFIRIGASVIMKQQLSGSLYFSFFFSCYSHANFQNCAVCRNVQVYLFA